MKKLILILLLFPFCLLAQTSLYEGLEANGTDAKYQEYYSVYKNDKGEQMIGGKRYQINIEVSKMGNLPVGFIGKKIEDGKNLFALNEERSGTESVGYPMVRAFDSGRAESYVLVGDCLFELKGLKEDGVTFSEIEAVYIKIEEKEKPTDGNKKKMSFKEKLAAAKNKLVEASSNSSDFKKKVDEDYKEMVSDYLKSMKAKFDAHTLTAKEKQEIATLKKLEVDHAAHIKHVNDSVWRTPEYQRILANQKRAKNASSGGNSSSSTTKKSDSGSASGGGFSGSVNLINDTGTKYHMFTSNGGGGWWNNSSSKTVRCEKNKTIYISTTNKSSDKRKLVTLSPSMCGKTIKISTLL
jgi:hypothetical protein